MSYCGWQQGARGFVAICSLVACSVANGALVAHYTFDEPEGSTTAFNSVSANGGDGAIGANVTAGVGGMVGNGILLPVGHGLDDIVNMGNATDIFDKLDASGQLTISYWLSSTHTAGGRNVAVFLGNNTVNNSYIDSGIVGGTSTPVGAAQGRNRGPATNNSAEIGELFSPEDVLVNNGLFHHVAFTVNTAADIHTGSLYVNGELVNTEADASKYGIFPAFNVFEVGRLGRGGSQSPVDGFAGVIDDLQIYSVALNAAQIASLHANPGTVVPEPGTALLLVSAVGLLAIRRRVTA